MDGGERVPADRGLARVQEALNTETVTRHWKHRLETRMSDPKLVAKLKRSYDSALDTGAVRDWRELYPDACMDAC
jgi:hypothetical protein